MDNFKYTACDNNICIQHQNCKRFKMYKLGANDVMTNGGTVSKQCKKFLPLKIKG